MHNPFNARTNLCFTLTTTEQQVFPYKYLCTSFPFGEFYEILPNKEKPPYSMLYTAAKSKIFPTMHIRIVNITCLVLVTCVMVEKVFCLDHQLGIFKIFFSIGKCRKINNGSLVITHYHCLYL